MPGLRALQAAFQRRVLDGDPGVAAHVEGTAALGPEARLAVYAGAYRARLVEALATDYPVLRACVGESDFEALGNAYLAAHPSTGHSLRWFGQHLPGFLRRHYARNLGELADFEWALAAAFDAADAPVAGAHSVAALPAAAWPGLRVRLHPSVDWITLHWNTLALWRAVKDGAPAPVPQPLAEPLHCLVWRAGLVTRFRSVDGGERAALDAVAAGATFAALCERLAASGDPEPVVVQRAASLMKTWLVTGLMSELIT